MKTPATTQNTLLLSTNMNILMSVFPPRLSVSLFIHVFSDIVMVIFIFTIKTRNELCRQKEGDRRACLEDKELNKEEGNWAVQTYGNVSQAPSVTELSRETVT